MKCEVKTQMGVFNPRFFFGFSPSAVEAIPGVFVPGG
jgi:hypothetical protein